MVLHLSLLNSSVQDVAELGVETTWSKLCRVSAIPAFSHMIFYFTEKTEDSRFSRNAFCERLYCTWSRVQPKANPSVGSNVLTQPV